MRKLLVDRFWEKVEKPIENGCWVWKAYKDKRGYGQFWPTRASPVRAHRVAWELANGPIPAGMDVLHHCDNPSCVYPAHLFLGTQSDNILDCVSKGRFNRPFGEGNWKAKLTASQVKEIRQATELSQRKLAEKYHVSQWTIKSILHRKSWKWLK